MEVTLEKKLELIGKINFFKSFDEADKVTMANMARFEKFEPGSKLIEQNLNNTNLYFIINGEVDIVINGDLVVTLYGGGHVFGEMGFVRHTLASASVVAKNKEVDMIFDTNEINLMTEPIYYKLRMDIYRSCAEILAKRLIDTNSIAANYIHQDKMPDL